MAARTGTFEVEKWYLSMGVLNSVCQLQTDNRLNDQFTRYMHENKTHNDDILWANSLLSYIFSFGI